MAHENFKALATKLINKNGAPAELVSFTSGGDAWNPTQTESLQDITAINLQLETNDIDGDLVKASDLKFLIDSSIEPSQDDRFRYENKDYSIIKINKLKPADTTIRYIIYVRL